MRLAIGCDEAAHSLKVALKGHLAAAHPEIKVTDFGANKGEVVLYPDIGYTVADAVAEGSFDRAILMCGTGIGMAICANKVPGVRAAVCHDPFSAERARKSNDTQVLCFGERVIGVELARYLVDIWLKCDFAGGDSAPKVDRIGVLEKAHFQADYKAVFGE